MTMFTNQREIVLFNIDFVLNKFPNDIEQRFVRQLILECNARNTMQNLRDLLSTASTLIVV